MGRQTTANDTIRRDVTPNQSAVFEPFSSSHSQKSVNGTKQRRSGRASAVLKNGDDRLRTLVTSARPAAGGGKRQLATSSTCARAYLRTMQPIRFGNSLPVGHVSNGGSTVMP